ncbi:MAG: HEAT repeat domain-containing protein, partial [Planctomycetota bacterium]
MTSRSLMLLLLVLPLLVTAQDGGGRVTELFEKLPAQDAEQRAELKKALSQFGRDEIRELCKELVVPGSGDDTRARELLHALVLVAGKQEVLRQNFMQVMGEVLPSDAAVSSKKFLLQQAQFLRDPELGAIVSGSLLDPELGSTAVRVLVVTGGESSAAALREALPQAPESNHIAIIDGLGVLRDPQAVPLLLERANSAKRRVHLAALAALVSIGDPDVAPLLFESMRHGSWQEQTQQMALTVELAGRLSQLGQPQEAMAILEQLRSAYPELAQVQSATLQKLAELQGVDALPGVIVALTSEDREIRAAAMDVAVRLPGAEVTGAYLTQLQECAPPAKAAVLAVLSRRGDAAALPAAVAELNDPEAEVRIAAVKAVATLGKERAVAPLVDFLNTDSTRERKEAQTALVKLSEKSVSSAIAQALQGASPDVRAALLQVLSGRRA